MKSLEANSGWKRRALSVLLAAAAMSPVLTGVVAMEGCKKKAPPPPPPPPPKPVKVEDPPVDVKAVLQAAKADRRVAVAPGIASNKEELVKAVIALADGLARGDDKKFGALIDPPSRAQLKGMVTAGQWAESTKKIEAVRVVRLMDGAESTPIDSGPAVGGDVKAAMFEAALKSLTPEQKEQLKKDLGHDPKVEDLELIASKLKEKFEEARDAGNLTDEQKKQMELAERGLAMLAAPEGEKKEDKKESSGDGSLFTVTLAVQEPGVAYVTSWIAVEVGGKWTFKASRAEQQGNRRRASDFDAIYNTASSPEGEPAPEAPPAGETPGAPGVDGGSSSGGGKGGARGAG